MFLWVTKSGNNYHMKLSIDTGDIFTTIQNKAVFSTNKFIIDYKFNIARIGFIDKHINIDSIDYNKILLLEKQHGIHIL